MLLLMLACAAPTDSAEPADTAWQWDDSLGLKDNCFADIGNSGEPWPTYETMGATWGHNCAGSNHQDIEGVERVIFLGDSVTAGTPPSYPEEYYRNVMTEPLKERFGDIEIDDCSAWGARTDDLMEEPHKQLLTCAPEPDPRRTLILFTIGGNDAMAANDTLNETGSEAEAAQVLVDGVQTLRTFFDWVRDNKETWFPGGVDIVYTNVYEFTDGTGDLSSCPTADAMGFGGHVDRIRDAYVYIDESYVSMAVEYQTDVVLLFENFCGHGWRSDDPTTDCYRGPDTERWLDPTCIHPNPAGHAELARMFLAVIDE